MNYPLFPFQHSNDEGIHYLNINKNFILKNGFINSIYNEDIIIRPKTSVQTSTIVCQIKENDNDFLKRIDEFKKIHDFNKSFEEYLK